VLPLGDDVLFSSSLAQASRDIGFAINIGSEDHVPPFCYGHVCIEQGFIGFGSTLCVFHSYIVSISFRIGIRNGQYIIFEKRRIHYNT
jgi:hypothetical protein